MIRIEVAGVDGVRKELARVQDAPKKAVREFADRIYRLAEDGADKHTKTGALFRSTYIRALPGGGWEIGHDRQIAPHAVFVHWGTRPHVIKPKNRKALRWVPKGGTGYVFAKEVRHPGNKGDPWLIRAADQAVREFPQIFAKHLKGR